METVLIIEDDSSMLRGLRDNFEYAGYNVLTAAAEIVLLFLLASYIMLPARFVPLLF